MAAARATGSLTGTSKPVAPSSTIWRQPSDVGGHHGEAHRSRLHQRQREAFPVRCEHEDVHAGIEPHDVRAGSEEPDAGLIRSLAVERREAVRLVGLIRPDGRHPDVGVAAPQLEGGREELGVPLLADQPAHDADHYVVVRGRAELAARRGPVRGRDREGVETLEVDPEPRIQGHEPICGHAPVA